MVGSRGSPTERVPGSTRRVRSSPRRPWPTVLRPHREETPSVDDGRSRPGRNRRSTERWA